MTILRHAFAGALFLATATSAVVNSPGHSPPR